MHKLLSISICSIFAVGAWTPHSAFSSEDDPNATFDRLVAEYVTGYLAWRPQTGTALGFHEYDGKVTNLSKPSQDSELARLKSFEQQLLALDPAHLDTKSAYDYRILFGSVRREIFGFEQAQIYSRNPMVYAAMDVNIEVVTRAENVFAEKVFGPRLGQGAVQDTRALGKFAANIDVGQLDIIGEAGEDHPLDELMRILVDDLAILESARL